MRSRKLIRSAAIVKPVGNGVEEDNNVGKAEKVVGTEKTDHRMVRAPAHTQTNSLGNS